MKSFVGDTALNKISAEINASYKDVVSKNKWFYGMKSTHGAITCATCI